MSILDTVKDGFEVAEKVVVKNLPIIMSVTASCGVFGTAALAVKEAPEAKKRYLEAHKQIEEKSAKSSLKALWSGMKPMLPAIGVGVASVACILGANAIHLSRYSELSDLYTNLAIRFSDYKMETKNLLGEAGAAAVIGKAANKKDISEVKETKNAKNRITDTGEKINLFYDEYSGTFFHATWKEVYDAQWKLEDKYLNEGIAALDDYYDFLGMDTPWAVFRVTEQLVWDANYIFGEWEATSIPFSYTPETEPLYRDDGTPYYGIQFNIEPVVYQEDGDYSKIFFDAIH